MLRKHLENIEYLCLWHYHFRRALPILKSGVRLIHGPSPPTLARDEMLVTLLVRNGASQIDSYINHHRRLGACHFVIIDNGSTDGTLEAAKQHSQVSVFATRLSFAKWKNLLKTWSGYRFGGAGWNLVADIDERFEHPYSDKLPLREFLRYLNAHNYNAVRAYMLDLVPLGPESRWPTSGEELEQDCRWYSIEDITWRPAKRTEGMEALGGIRKTIFGANPNLSKLPLTNWSSGARPELFSAHKCRTARVADMTALLRHLKFDRDFRAYCLDAVARRCYYNESSEYHQYLSVLDDVEDFTFSSTSLRKLDDIDQLLEEGFLSASEKYLDYVSGQKL